MFFGVWRYHPPSPHAPLSALGGNPTQPHHSAATRGDCLGKRWPPLPYPVMSSSRSSRLPAPSDVDPDIVVKYLERLGVTPETTRAIRDEVRADCCAPLPPPCLVDRSERRLRCVAEVPIMLRSIVLHRSWLFFGKQMVYTRRRWWSGGGVLSERSVSSPSATMAVCGDAEGTRSTAIYVHKHIRA